MTKELYKAIMTRSRLKNKFLKLKTIASRNAYKKQRNLCMSLLRSTKKSYYENLDPDLLSDNKKFWKHVKPFSDKTPSNNNITLLENNQIVIDNTTCAEILNTYFIESVQNLEIDLEMYVNKITILDDPIDNIEKFKDHPSILWIPQKQFPPNSFSFVCVTEEDVRVTIKRLNSKKAYQVNNIPPPPP